MLRRLVARTYDRLLNSSARYSLRYSVARDLFAYSAREEMLRIAMEFVVCNKIDGDYLEFGVFQGESFAAAHHFARARQLDGMRFYAFDSFAGLPEVRDLDAEGEAPQFHQGQFATELEAFEKLLRRKRVDLDRVTIVPGWFDQSLTEETRQTLPIKQAAIVWVDCDLYESTVPVLDFVTDYVQDGTVMVFDDWYCFRAHPQRGERRAVAEWLERNPGWELTRFHQFNWHGQSFILNRVG